MVMDIQIDIMAVVTGRAMVVGDETTEQGDSA
jgi:hypothetical protein